VITGKHGFKIVAMGLNEVQSEDYILLLLPGGKAPAKLQKEVQVVAMVRFFLEAGKPVAAFCTRIV